MPGLVRKLVVFAAVDGLILQPQAPWNARGAPSIHISYDTHDVRRLSQLEDVDGTRYNGPAAGKSVLEVHAIIGLLHIASSAYLIAVSRREQVAQIWNKPVYAITDVSVIPVSSQEAAETAIVRAARTAAGDSVGSDDESESEADHHTHLEADWLDDLVHNGDQGAAQQQPQQQSRSRRESVKEASVAEDVIGRKGAYGRFSGGWFSRTGWLSGQRKRMGLTGSEDAVQAGGEASAPASATSSPRLVPARPKSVSERLSLDAGGRPSSSTLKDTKTFGDMEQRITALTPKLVQTAKLLFGSRTFFYAYDHDITRRLSDQARPTTNVPLHRRVEPQYFWNHHLVSPLIDQGLDEYVVPIMQGFVGQRSFSMTSTPTGPTAEVTPPTETPDTNKQSSYLVTLISRRSTHRLGLRYLRRGIDEEGNVANAVETEQLLSSPTWDATSPVQSFVQIRGSIPLFFTQTPYHLKPVPALHGSPEANAAATRLHFDSLAKRYGLVHSVSLVNSHGTEAKIGQAYQDAVSRLNDDESSRNVAKIGFEWFDFHEVCKGMKFENVAQLMSSSAPFVDKTGWCVLSDGNLEKTQDGVLRINCMDCLDRTNVVQSSYAERILSKQLSAVTGGDVDLRSDPTTTWLATLWADNGDAVSLAYTSTAALKGDFVRTRQRNVFGLLTDLSLTLSRYYHNLFEDFFAQSAIDYMLGNVNATVFGDIEAGVRGADLSVDVNRMRRVAVEACARRLLESEAGAGEELLGGWAMAAPAQRLSDLELPQSGVAGLVKGVYGSANRVMHEAVFLITDRSVAHVAYDWEAERVGDVRRVPLERISSLQWGTWICETSTASQTDETRNAGFLVVYEQDEAARGAIVDGARPQPPLATLAFKALPTRSAVVRPEQQDTIRLDERQLVQHVCGEVARAVAETKRDGPVPVVEKDIVSLQEARKNTGYIDQLGNSLRKLVWG